jgi:predicted NodU family carbamoyl transferase
VASEPLVDSPEDAINTFYNSGLDALIINKFCILK